MSVKPQDYDSDLDQEYLLIKVFYYFFTLNRVIPSETRIFTEIKHNELCEKLLNMLELILGYFNRYRTISYDIQGIKDSGSDVILSYYEGEKRKFICFQIKSHGDLKEKNYLKNIKAQYADSRSKFDFVDYYLILATDEKAAKDKIRSIKAELSKYDKLTIVDPSQFLFLLSLKSSQVGSIIKSFLFQGDILIKKSLDIIKGLIRPQRILIFCLLDLCIRNGFKPVKCGDIFDSEQLREAYESYSEENDICTFSVSLEESVTSYLEALNNAFFEADFDNQIICPDFIFMQPLVALILEGIIRYEFNNEEIIEYLEGLLSI